MTEKNFKVKKGLTVLGGASIDSDAIVKGNLDVRGAGTVTGNLTVTGDVTGANIIGTLSQFDSQFSGKSTTDLSEGSNLYYTTARHDSDFAVKLDSSSTDNLSEGSTNLYYTSARADSDAKNAISVTDAGEAGSLSYNPTTGVITYTGASAAEVRQHFTGVDSGGDGSFSYNSSTGQFTYVGPSPAEARAHFAAIDAGGDGSFTYDSSTGQFTYTGPSASEVRAHISQGTGVTITNGQIAIGQSVGTSDDVTFGKLTADSAALNNIVLTRRTDDPVTPGVGGELFFDSDPSKNLTFIPRTKEGNTDVRINIGQEELVYIKNETGGQINNGEVINFIGADSEGNPLVEKTLASSAIEGPVGVATMDIPNNAHGFVTTQGLVRGFDTIRKDLGGPFSVGDRAYICNVNPGGFVKHDIGPDSGYPYQLGTVVIADSNDGVLFVNGVREHWTRARFSGKVKTSGELQADGKVTTKAITFDGTVPEYAEGTIFYDSANGAIAFKNDVSDITMQIGQEDWIRVYNNSGSQINNGQPVYLDSSYNNFPTIELADATSATAVHAIGLATHNIANGSYGYVTTKGVVNDIDTSAFNVGDKVHVGTTAGTLSTTAPTYPNYAVDIGQVVTADSAGAGGSIYVNIVDRTFEVTRTTGDARVDGALTVGGNLTVLGTQTIASQENISIGGALNYLNSGNTIGDANTTFTGSGLDDAVLTGHYTGTATNQKFYVKIDGTGTPDTFEWGLADSASPVATGVAITGAEQELQYGIKVDFEATTGHTTGDTWKGSASPVNVDTGWFSNRNTGTSGVGYTHLGMFFDVSTEKFTLLERYDSEPSGEIDLNDSSVTYATLKAGTFEGNLTGSVTGNASTATLLQNARTIAISGDVTGTATSFNGGSNITISSAITAGSIVNADINASAAIADSKLATISTAGKVQNSATTATSANTGSAIVARDASGNFNAGTITATAFVGDGSSLTGVTSYVRSNFDSDFDDRTASMTTDSLGEGSSNLYFTTQRARNSLNIASNGYGSIAYDSASGKLTYTGPSDAQIRGRISVTDNGGDGALSYNNSTGVISYTGPSAAEVRAHLSSGTGITYNSSTGAIATNDGAIVHDNLSGFVANEHIDHSSVSITAGNGLTGGGTIAASRTLNVVGGGGINVNANNIAIDSAEIRALFSGSAGVNYNSSTGAFDVDEANVSHDNLSGFVANEHINHSSVSITAGAGLTGGGTIASTRTLNVGAGNYIIANADDIAVDATNLNTASKVVARDASGNFSAGTITASLSGNASTATTLATARSIGISLSGDVAGSGSASFDGSGNITITASNMAVQANSVALGTDTTGNYMSGVSAGTGISVSHTPGEGSTATISTNDGAIVHDNLSGFVANEHINHTSVSMTAGSGLTGGGNIASTRTFNVGAGNGIRVTADAVHLDSAGVGAGTYGSTSDGTKIDQITVNEFGQITNITTGATGDIKGVTAGTMLTGGGTSGTVTLNVDGAAVFTDLKTRDGSGSGLDADLLDGQHGSYYRINVYNSAGTLLN